jgi:hypothetical protein
MQLPGPGVWGPPRDRAAAEVRLDDATLAVLDRLGAR